jgi:acyl dehydratase
VADPRTLTLDSTPNLTVLFARAAATSIGRGGPLQDVQVRRPKARVHLTQLAAYDKVCGFVLRDALPATYLHVLVFPLQVTLMADRRFPLGLAGLVHVRNRIVQHRPVDVAELLTLRSSARALRPHAKGAQVDLVGEVRVGDELVWEGVSTYLSRGASVPEEFAREQPVNVDLAPDAPANAVWDVPGDMGRRYAAVSGDVDPMHLSSLAAKAFGFPRALVQGMWTKARALAAIEARLPEAYAVDVAFGHPLLLPSTASFFAAQQDHGWDFAVRPAQEAGDHLRGTVRAI